MNVGKLFQGILRWRKTHGFNAKTKLRYFNVMLYNLLLLM